MSKVVKSGYTVNETEAVAIPDVQPQAQETKEGEGTAPQTKEEKILYEQHYEVIVQKAKEEAEAMAQSIIMGAIRQKDGILQEAAAAADDIREQARAQGYSEGHSQAVDACMANINSTIEKTGMVLLDINSKLEEFFELYEDAAADLAIDIADKIMLQRLQKDSDNMLPLIKRLIAEIGTGAGDLTLTISQKLDDIESLLLRDLPNYVTVKTTDGELGLCTVESKLGAIDASIGVQLAKMKKLIKEHK